MHAGTSPAAKLAVPVRSGVNGLVAGKTPHPLTRTGEREIWLVDLGPTRAFGIEVPLQTLRVFAFAITRHTNFKLRGGSITREI
jgi:hypothetical protein